MEKPLRRLCCRCCSHKRDTVAIYATAATDRDLLQVLSANPDRAFTFIIAESGFA